MAVTKLNGFRVTSEGVKFFFPTRELEIVRFENGIAIAKVRGHNIQFMIAGAVEALSEPEYSEIVEILNEVFEYDGNQKLYGIAFEYNGVTMLVPRNKTVQELVEEYESNLFISKGKFSETKEERDQKFQKAKELKRNHKKKILSNKVLEAELLYPFEFKDEEAQKEYLEFSQVNDDAYSKGIIEFSMRWAKFMQYIMENNGNARIEKIAQNASEAADKDGITGFMYGMSVTILAEYWKHGEELRIWHNSQYGVDTEGVVNPAVLTIN